MNIESDIILYANESRFNSPEQASGFLVVLSIAVAQDLNMMDWGFEPTLSAISITKKSKDHARIFFKDEVLKVNLSERITPLQRQTVMHHANRLADAHTKNNITQ